MCFSLILDPCGAQESKYWEVIAEPSEKSYYRTDAPHLFIVTIANIAKSKNTSYSSNPSKVNAFKCHIHRSEGTSVSFDSYLPYDAGQYILWEF